MTESEALALIEQALLKALTESAVTSRESVDISIDTDLLDDEIIDDSLDGMVFFMELSESTGKTIPEVDLVEGGFYKVRRLVDFLTA